MLPLSSSSSCCTLPLARSGATTGVRIKWLAKIQNPSFVAKRTRSDYFVENRKEEEEDRHALFHALDCFRKQEAVPDILAGMRTVKDLFDPPDRVVAAFLACPEEMDAAVQDLMDASTRKMTTLGEKTWAQHIARRVDASGSQIGRAICEGRPRPLGLGCIGL